jgi:isoleucyl-tRNA synthetase
MFPACFERRRGFARFGRPEWGWPKGVGKLKTIAQILKEQGGFEVLGTVTGAEMIGWEYVGPFDDLPAQKQPGGLPADPKLGNATGVSCHRVVDGGRDSEGKPTVVAGEGTGIVHTAPGCGDIDYTLLTGSVTTAAASCIANASRR